MRTHVLLCFCFCIGVSHAVDINVNASEGRLPISPYIYGRNNVIGSWPDGNTKARDSVLQIVRDAGVKILRENGGNNSTKYNWKNRLSSHPDWFNNVYDNNWDAKADVINTSLTGVQGLFAFQLLGWAADNTTHNWNDWDWGQTHGWTYPNTGFDLAGGGAVNTAGSAMTVKGNYRQYLRAWPADSSVGILDYWFGSGGRGFKKEQYRYWNMDNEPEIWNATHDDVVDTAMSAEQYMRKYFAVAMAARQKYPEIKLVGPVFTNEWQWFKWQTDINYKGRYHSWIEYFIRRVAEKQDSTGQKLLDVLDFHFYPGLSGVNAIDAQTMAQIHRLWFDTSWVYPKANGLKSVNGGWDENLTRYAMWRRANAWLNQYMGSSHNVKLGMTECGALSNTSAQQAAHWYASHLGTFADIGAEVFTPWDWYPGQWEALHLFSRNAKSVRIDSKSSADSLVSAYSSISATGDSLTVILVNHHRTLSQPSTVKISGFAVTGSSANTFQLSDLPNRETFISHTSNALKSNTQALVDNGFTLSLPPLSITAVLLNGKTSVTSMSLAQPVGDIHIQLMGHKKYRLQIPAAYSGQKVLICDVRGAIVQEWAISIAGPRAEMTTIEWDAGNVARGIYILSINQTRKLVQVSN